MRPPLQAQVPQLTEETLELVEETLEPAEETLKPVEETLEPVEETLEPVEDTLEPVEDTVGLELRIAGFPFCDGSRPKKTTIDIPNDLLVDACVRRYGVELLERDRYFAMIYQAMKG